MGPLETYIAGGGTFPNERTAALLMSAEESHRNRSQRISETGEDREARWAHDRAAREVFLSHCRRATPTDYRKWLTGWRRRGGKVTHTYEYPMPDRFYVLTSPSLPVPQLYGALSLDVIVPRGVIGPDDLPKRCGHSSFYFLDGYRHVGFMVGAYNDTGRWW